MIGRRLAALALLIAASGCDDDKGVGGATRPAPTASASVATGVASPADEAKSILQSRCAMCHGAGGKGDGPTAATLNPKPRDFTSKEWQRSVTDEQLRTVILKGGAATGKSALMPPNPDLEGKPAVVAALVTSLRDLGK